MPQREAATSLPAGSTINLAANFIAVSQARGSTLQISEQIAISIQQLRFLIAAMIGLNTGGSRGLGKEMALTFAREGHDVIITYRSKAVEAAAVVTQIKELDRKALALQLDVTNVKSFDAFVESISDALKVNFQAGKGRIDYLVDNAGIGANINIVQVTEDDFDKFSNVHLKDVFLSTQKALPILRDGGSIVTISTSTTRVVNPGYSLYASMKSAIETFTRYLASEAGARGIRANCVAPGPVVTDFNNAAIRSNPQLQNFLANLSPLGRVGQPDDIGSVVAFCAAQLRNGSTANVLKSQEVSSCNSLISGHSFLARNFSAPLACQFFCGMSAPSTPSHNI
jgi:NAD(P)-dependent dehydrogenase (short-subunit alcohol dehydrogenase family)